MSSKYIEEVYNQYYDTAGNYHYTGVNTGHHEIKLGVYTEVLSENLANNKEKISNKEDRR